MLYLHDILHRNFKVSISTNELNSCPQTCPSPCALKIREWLPEAEPGALLLLLAHPYTSNPMSFLLP